MKMEEFHADRTESENGCQCSGDRKRQTGKCAAAKKDASIVRIEKDRKADRLLEQPTYGKPEKEENALEEIREQASNLDATQMKNEMLLHQTILREKTQRQWKKMDFP